MDKELIPWLSVSDWNEANDALRVIIDRHSGLLDAAVVLAIEIRLRLAALYPMSNRLGQRFCTVCNNPCCRVATVWYDYTDLVYIHLNQLTLPPRQILKRSGTGCIYLDIDGCTLPRWVRPWICTWYLCPNQKDYLRTCLPAESTRFFRELNQIKGQRKYLEHKFIQAVTE